MRWLLRGLVMMRTLGVNLERPDVRYSVYFAIQSLLLICRNDDPGIPLLSECSASYYRHLILLECDHRGSSYRVFDTQHCLNFLRHAHSSGHLSTRSPCRALSSLAVILGSRLVTRMSKKRALYGGIVMMGAASLMLIEPTTWPVMVLSYGVWSLGRRYGTHTT